MPSAAWNKRYLNGETPWDFGGVPAALSEFLLGQPPGRVLIPGCGSGHEIGAFARAGWTVEAVDFAPEAVRRARERAGQAEGVRIRQADFFSGTAEPPFDVVYERTFLCALPPRLRPAYAEQMARRVKPGGLLAGFFFFGPEIENGPPFPLPAETLAALLDPAFTRIKDAAVADSLPLFAGRERWQVWRRK